MLGHLGINVDDLVTAKRYYDQIMPLLGFEPFLSAEDEFAYQPANGKRGTFIFFYPAATQAEYSNEATGLQHLAFSLKTRAAVDSIHQVVADLGSTVVHEPQHFPQYPQPYYATFWRDPHGFLLEAVCHYDRD